MGGRPSRLVTCGFDRGVRGRIADWLWTSHATDEFPLGRARAVQCRTARLPGVDPVRIPINLASEPFRRDRPLIVASTAVALLLMGSLLMFV